VKGRESVSEKREREQEIIIFRINFSTLFTNALDDCDVICSSVQVDVGHVVDGNWVLVDVWEDDDFVYYDYGY
jgi:hypothetical protein